MVCVPVGTGVLELDSTDVVFQTVESMAKIRSLFEGGGRAGAALAARAGSGAAAAAAGGRSGPGEN
jgi:hypothetical protein